MLDFWQPIFGNGLFKNETVLRLNWLVLMPKSVNRPNFLQIIIASEKVLVVSNPSKIVCHNWF